MDYRKLNRRNFIFLLFILAACVTGGRSIFGYWTLLVGYHNSGAELSAYMASEMYMMYLGFLVCIIGSIVMSFLSKAKVSRRFFIIRNIFIVASLVLANMSLPNITVMSTVVMSRYIGDTAMLEYALSSPLLVSATTRPYLYYAYMVAEVLMVVIGALSIYRYFVDKRSNNNYNNMNM